MWSEEITVWKKILGWQVGDSVRIKGTGSIITDYYGWIFKIEKERILVGFVYQKTVSRPYLVRDRWQAYYSLDLFPEYLKIWKTSKEMPKFVKETIDFENS